MEGRLLRSKIKVDPGPNYMHATLGIERDRDSDDDFVPDEENGTEEEDQVALVREKPTSGRKGRKEKGKNKKPGKGPTRKDSSTKSNSTRNNKRSFLSREDRASRKKSKKSQQTKIFESEVQQPEVQESEVQQPEMQESETQHSEEKVSDGPQQEIKKMKQSDENAFPNRLQLIIVHTPTRYL
ncbi:hypothetical protein KRP22_014312 [Phytophthora ramorum]|uniref:uncharacterized protein n=1 Tax=Phytophthora ramorum TaxID=164328 RepID=UPI0030A5034B|nr:hypothetical protein KRP23_12127 [Phytophthora ramorum]KAH7501630.1 hypothetical protein KRP22_9088 [Phytophthora ramorum]